MPTNHRIPQDYTVTIEADRPRDLARVPQALKAIFHIVLNDVQFKLLIENGTIELTVPEKKAKQLEAALKPFAVRMLLRQFGVRITIKPVEAEKPEEEDSDAQEPPQFKVSGQVVTEDGKPVADIVIKAFDRNLRSEDFLGDVFTNSAGRYEIQYTFEQFARAEKGTADLIIRAFNEAGTLLAESDIHFNAPRETVINLTVSKTSPIVPSEYELLNAMLTPLLNGVTLPELTEKDIWFLINETDIEEISQMFPAGGRSIELLAKSAALFKETNLYVEVFYGLKRVYFTYDGAEIPDLKDLLAEEPEWWQEGLSKACEENIIPAWVCERLDEVLRNVNRLRREQELNDQEQWIRQEVVVHLVNKKTEAPVPGFIVRAYDLDSGEEPEEIGYSISDGLGKLTLFYAVPPDEETSSSRNLRLVVFGPGGKEISSHSELWRPGMTLLLEVDVPETPEVGASPISEVITSMEVEEGELRELLAHLETKGISTLADIRRIRGLGGVEGLPLAPDHPVVRTLEAHARLAILPTELTENQNLINAGYTSAIQIADTSPEEFTRRVSDEFSITEAARIHAGGAAVASVLDNQAVGYLGERANGRGLPIDVDFDFRVPDQGDDMVDIPEPVHPHPCRCRDCENAASPASYLTDLLAYATRTLKAGGNSINLGFLENTFRQPFSSLPVSCRATEEEIRQARITVEVLRNYLRNNQPVGGYGTVVMAGKEYVRKAYTALLMLTGTSSQELHLAMSDGQEKQEALAVRLGIRPEHLQELLHDVEELTEQTLEKLFGLTDTIRDPLSTGAKLNDRDNLINRWFFKGAEWDRNTDPEGNVHIILIKQSGGEYLVKAYRDTARTKLVAEGESSTAAGTVHLSEKNHSGLSGSMVLNDSGDSNNIIVSLKPLLLCRRLQHLRDRWHEIDRPADRYLREPRAPYESEDLHPVIDPDLIGPDDLRNPKAGDPAFDLWLKRRKWVDERLDDIQDKTTTVNAHGELPEAILQVMKGDIFYASGSMTTWPAGISWHDLHALHVEITGGENPSGTQEKVENELRLTIAAFTRLLEIKTAHDSWIDDERNAELSADAWLELYSILVLAQKRAFFAIWREEEKETEDSLSAVFFSPKRFVVALREPGEGTWPAGRPEGQPWIDPDKRTEADLPESHVGNRARQLLEDRRKELAAITVGLQENRESQGFEGLLIKSLGARTDESNWIEELDDIRAQLLGENPDEARERIKVELRMTEEEFSLLMKVKDKDEFGLNKPESRPSAGEWTDIYALLTRVHKEKFKYEEWRQVEDDAGLEYWQVLKARLPGFRASVEARQEWLRALQIRCLFPLIDPDVITLGHLRPPLEDEEGRSARDLWQARRDWVNGKLRDHQDARESSQNDSGEWLVETLQSILGLSAEEFKTLADKREQGQDISGRLAQLGLTRKSFSYLVRIYNVLSSPDGDTTILQSDWGSINSILVQAEKRLEFADWRDEEEKAGLIHGPENFNLSEPSPLQFPQPELEPLSEWRASWRDLREWENTLVTRIRQQKTVIDALHEAVSNTEKEALPVLRDALIWAAHVDGDNMDEKAQNVTNEFLIDMKTGGCRITTRIGQAIETIQKLLWSVRTGQYHDRALQLDTVNFDEEWRWLGSYSTWRAAMMVFLYPENILYPSLRKNQTPAFRRIVQETRANPRFSHKDALKTADLYANYFRDVCSLNIEATCWIPSNNGNYNEGLLYMFARSRKTNHMYWSLFDNTLSEENAQSFWSHVKVDGQQGGTNLIATRILGSVLYKEHIYVFFLKELDEPEVKQVVIKRGEDSWRHGEPLTIDLIRPESGFEALPIQVIKKSSLQEFRGEESPPMLAVNHINSFNMPNGDLSYKSFIRYYEMDDDGSNWKEPLTDWLPLGEGKEWYWPKSRFCGVYRLNKDNYYILSERDNSLYLLDTRLQFYPDQVYWWHLFYNNQTAREERAEHEIGTSLDGPKKWLGMLPWTDSERKINLCFLMHQHDALPRFVNLRVDHIRRGYGDLSRFTPTKEGFPDGIGGKLAPVSGQPVNGNPLSQFFAHESYNRGTWITRFTPSMWSEDASSFQDHIKVTPEFPATLQDAGVFDLSAPWSKPVLEEISTYPDRRELLAAAFATQAGATRSVLTYLEEAYYSLPLYMALELQRAGEHTTALDWYRLIYDYSAPADRRKIYYRLVLEESDEALYSRRVDWLLDPLNPHLIASTRRNTYTRFTLFSIVRCLLEYADAEFTIDTAESVARAIRLYTTALDLLSTDELNQKLGVCEDLIGRLDNTLDGLDEPEEDKENLRDIIDDLRERYEDLSHHVDVKWLADKINRIITDNESGIKDRIQKVQDIMTAAQAKEVPQSPLLEDVLGKMESARVRLHDSLMMNPALASSAQEAGRIAGHYALTATSSVTEVVLKSHQKALIVAAPITPANTTLVRHHRPISPMVLFKSAQGFCIPPNPIIRALRLRAELNLYKIRTCRNIAGMERQLAPYAASTDIESGLPAIGARGQLALPGITSLQPTPYRYAVLIERAKVLVNLAQHIEAAFLSILEKRDAEAYNRLKARHDIHLTRAGVRLQDLRIREAEGGVSLAELQSERAELQAETYNEWINTGLIEHELMMLEALEKALTWQRLAMIASFGNSALTMVAGAIAGSAAGPGGTTAGAVIGALLTIGSVAPALGSVSGFYSQQANLSSAQAGYERRKQEWEFQHALAQHDIRIGNQQITLARDRVRVVGQERTISVLQSDHASEIADFLDNKFTNVELYDWMSGILEGVYAFFLQQATGIARLAENQLAFERQETPPPYIQGDYWLAPTNGAMGGSTGSEATDRRGLTGSARLLRDIHQLDQYAFETDKRKLQLTRTISLARLGPAEFQRFRETGVMLFATPMEMFDRDFPGHYLRLIKRVRTSVIALIPTTEGIRATLSTTGVSRVVIGGPVFQTTLVNTGPQSVALTSPQNATGLFELDPQPEMLMPFEKLGVDTSWEFRMPKASNPFDYSTIADVLVTIEYTALNSYDYRPQVIQRLDRSFSADRPFSFRYEFADAWYDLHNPELREEDKQMVVTFRTRREDFPPNLEDLKINRVLLYFARAEGRTFEVPVTHLRFSEKSGTGTVDGGSAISNDGLISTGNANSWGSMIGKSPYGEWELSLTTKLDDGRAPKELFRNEEITDVLFVISFSGTTPEWPA